MNSLVNDIAKDIPVKSYPKFLLVWAGQLMSGLGNGMTAFALGVYVYRQTQSATNFAMVTLCLFIPSILLRPLGGVLADRFDRRFLIIGGDLGSAVAVLFLLMCTLSGNLSLWKIYLGVGINSIFTALQAPAYKASVTDLLTAEQFAKAGGLVQLASSAQHLFSPVAAGFLLSVASLEAILLVDLSTFLIAVAAVLTIRRRCGAARQESNWSFSKDLGEGWRAVTSNRGVLHVVLLISLITFFVGFLQTLFAPMLLSFTAAKTLGLVQSISATGMLLSSLLLGILGSKGKHSTILLTSLAAAGLCMALMGITTNIVFITAVFFLFFCALPLINTSADVLIRTKIPNEQQGRAWGIIGLLSQIGYILAYSTSGVLADRLFNPLLMKNGPLADSVGRLIGIGLGRGIGLMYIIAGMTVVLVTAVSSSIISRTEQEYA
ncbi:MAG: MFS transporter [Spirochaetaceae bacterium]|nr:MFS transporter [Spirochaetaceae bacterium]MCF7949105.1 MFS transporter [Spirochaetia bacterium]MCF7952314.1 MFS transporter [Spirochaetaceae bacterium]